MNDYGADWPLWAASAEADRQIDRLLDDGLTARLRDWADTFQSHFDHLAGWDDPLVAAEHRTEGRRLLAALRDALPPPWEVRLDSWETPGD